MHGESRRAYLETMSERLAEWEALLGLDQSGSPRAQAPGLTEDGATDALVAEDAALRSMLAQLSRAGDDGWDTIREELEGGWDRFKVLVARRRQPAGAAGLP